MQNYTELQELFTKIVDVCLSNEIDLHPIQSFYKLIILSSPIPGVDAILNDTKKELVLASTKQQQSKVIKSLCINLVRKMNSLSSVDSSIIDGIEGDISTYNIDSVINESNRIMQRVEEAFTTKNVRDSIRQLELAVIETKALLIRIKDSMIYEEVTKLTGINENNITDVLHFNDYTEGKYTIAEKLMQILLFIKTHFK